MNLYKFIIYFARTSENKMTKEEFLKKVEEQLNRIKELREKIRKSIEEAKKSKKTEITE